MLSEERTAPGRTRTGPGARHPVIVWLALLGIVALAVLGSMSPAQAATNKTGFGVVPATATGLDSRSLFSFGLTPGSVAYDHVAVVNYSSKKLGLDIYATDAVNAAKGGYGLRAASEKPVGLGAWVIAGSGSPRSRTVAVPARRKDGQPGRVILPVAITVPANATPGDHAGAIVASLVTLGKNAKGENIRLEQRVAGRIYVRVAGPLQPGLSVTTLRAHFVKPSKPWRAGSVAVDYTVTNDGNLRMGFHSSVRVSGPVGLGARRLNDEPVAELLPGNSRTFRSVVPGAWAMGRLHVAVSVTPTAAIAAEPPHLGVIRSSTDIWAFTWVLVVLLLLALALLGYVVYRQIRRRLDSGDRGKQGTASSTGHIRAPVSSVAR